MIYQNAGASKNVRFDDLSERTLLFSPTDAPLTLTSEPTSTAGGDTAEGPTDGTSMFLKLSRDKRFIILNPTFTAPSTLQPIRLESLELSPSYRLIRGKVAVLNIAFQKDISILFSLDNWKTVSEVAAEHLQSHHEGHSVVSDLFSFVIDKDNLPLDTGNILQLCARYAVANQLFWDNNNERNYRIHLVT
ncbi:uncharacterized protein N7469_002279 [Penicillium citrinum]|uniref:CBM21 domain-containing protein n=1 Tax=Penicillium citrinum TaxID=5077 RepID=A0A9W9PCD5_PENCI|nr:uncharacterized protein N7469_002279 [Penicillium citrinum]KAJ5240688.1 hypothetical protein N7469_002279 [Penicillium citrinum]